MGKKIKLELTQLQFNALIDVLDTHSASIGTGDDNYDAIEYKNIKTLDRMLKSNGYKRLFN